jgi:hypothetical protein
MRLEQKCCILLTIENDLQETLDHVLQLAQKQTRPVRIAFMEVTIAKAKKKLFVWLAMKSVSSASLWSSHFLEFLLLLYPGFLQ